MISDQMTTVPPLPPRPEAEPAGGRFRRSGAEPPPLATRPDLQPLIGRGVDLLLPALFDPGEAPAANDPLQFANIATDTRIDGRSVEPLLEQVDALIGLRGDAAGFDAAIAALDDEGLSLLVRAALGETRQTLQHPGGEQRLPVVYNAARLQALQQVAGETGCALSRARVLARINETVAGLRPDARIRLADGEVLRTTPVPSVPASAESVARKKTELARQMQNVEALRQTGTPEAQTLADRLESFYHAREMARLATDVYHWSYPVDNLSPPAGWLRASADPALMAEFGIEPDQLRPPESGFRAELYVPDPAIYEGDAKPVLTFKGTTPSSIEDWSNNFAQAIGERSDYYERAMKLATKLEAKIEGGFEMSGHSLGGGLASAASAVSGAPATTFNAAGLHPDTAGNYMMRYGLGTPYETGETVKAFWVDGDILTTLQQSGRHIDPERADQIGAFIKAVAANADRPFIREKLEARFGPLGDIGVLRHTDGADLLNMPLAAGSSVMLDAIDGNGKPSSEPALELAGADGILTKADQALDRIEERLNRIDTAGDLMRYPEGALAELVLDANAVQKAYREFRADPVVRNVGKLAAESSKRHGMAAVDLALGYAIVELEQQTPSSNP